MLRNAFFCMALMGQNALSAGLQPGLLQGRGEARFPAWTERGKGKNGKRRKKGKDKAGMGKKEKRRKM